MPVVVGIAVHGFVGLVAAAVAVFALPFIYAMYKAIEWRWWVSGVRFGDVRFESGMRQGALVGLYWKVLGWSCLIVLGLAIWFGATLGIGYSLTEGSSPEERFLTLSQHWGFMIPSAFGYVAGILAFWAVMRIYLIHDIWQRVAGSATVRNLEVAADVATQGEAAGALGEGLASSLDVVGI